MGSVAERLAGCGVARVELIGCEMQDVQAFGELAGEAQRRLGRIELLLVAVGALGSPGQELPDPLGVAALIGSNFTGPAAALAAFAPFLVGQGGGYIVVLSSVAGVRVRRANLVYGAAKAGLDGFSLALAAPLAEAGVKLLVVRPGFVRTKMTAGRRPQPLAVGPQRVAAAVLTGLDRGAALVWVPGVLRPIFALARLVPRRLWWRITT